MCFRAGTCPWIPSLVADRYGRSRQHPLDLILRDGGSVSVPAKWLVGFLPHSPAESLLNQFPCVEHTKGFGFAAKAR